MRRHKINGYNIVKQKSPLFFHGPFPKKKNCNLLNEKFILSLWLLLYFKLSLSESNFNILTTMLQCATIKITIPFSLSLYLLIL